MTADERCGTQTDITLEDAVADAEARGQQFICVKCGVTVVYFRTDDIDPEHICGTCRGDGPPKW